MKNLYERLGPDSGRAFETRSANERDYARIVHSAAFRRLQGKTQTLGVGESDFPRTRLTHSLEVSRVGVGIVHSLKKRLGKGDDGLGLPAVKHAEVTELMPSDQLMQSICLAHDIGHPPFGHGGEVALNFHMRHFGGFEGNGQTLRILSRLEAYTPQHGMNLTRRALLGVLKYPLPFSAVVNSSLWPEGGNLADHPIERMKPPKCYLDSEQDVVNWLLEPFSEQDRGYLQASQPISEFGHGKPLCKAFDTSIMELADDISYGVHDLEDAVSLGLVRRDDWRHTFDVQAQAAELPGWFDEPRLFGLFFGQPYERKEAIGEIVHRLMLGIQLSADERFEHVLLAHQAVLPAPERHLLRCLHGMVVRHVIGLPAVQMLEYKGQQMVSELFRVFAGDPRRFLPEALVRRHGEAASKTDALRVVCDHVASLSDDHAARLYQKLFLPKMGSAFDVM
ncbi:dNTP triphosphohydrolase [Chitinimonas arctica]|uniref:Deoxyguanosinetriphosphate triphosphohydrolase-like protein n=1 Tax=Chitinimonas arctica TaxID=2594795 RepID=A0A516SGW5_9NEIS|nr:anti-phage deoxyguanosine triphosphatase [Chitinimonas arctica]QDQ27407.1 dNTP triphosphohydrolase [Chitinimonas arctica]